MDGLSLAERSRSPGIASLGIALGFWWIYFDIIGGRFPQQRPILANWILNHTNHALHCRGRGVSSV